MTNSFLFNDPNEIGDTIGDCMLFCLRKIDGVWKNIIFPSLIIVKDTIKPFFDNPYLKNISQASFQ